MPVFGIVIARTVLTGDNLKGSAVSFRKAGAAVIPEIPISCIAKAQHLKSLWISIRDNSAARKHVLLVLAKTFINSHKRSRIDLNEVGRITAFLTPPIENLSACVFIGICEEILVRRPGTSRGIIDRKPSQ